MSRSIMLFKRLQNLVFIAFPDIHQHVGIGEFLHRSRLLLTLVGSQAVYDITSIVVLQYLSIGNRGHTVIVILEPSTFLVRFDERKVMTTVQITGMDQDTIELVNLGRPTFRGSLVQELGEIDRVREFMTVVDLRQSRS